MDESTRAGRLFAIRAALGEGVRKPLPLREMAALLTERAEGGRRFHASQLSGWETGASDPTVDDVAVIAAVDPLHRGAAWLAWGDPPLDTTAAPHHDDEEPISPDSFVDADLPPAGQRKHRRQNGKG